MTLSETTAGILAGRSAILVNRMTTRTRPTAATLADRLGATITDKVTTQTDLLIRGSCPGTSADTVGLNAARPKWGEPIARASPPPPVRHLWK
ncbi:BRCT domain-containing protein [Rhodococcus koreensis]|uniref:hypothetical protein n=1 Tax=Rhodococcus koreensis TaxID=99653 RepID=UPI0036DED918